MKIILCSQKDIAGMNIKKILIDKYGYNPTDKEFEGSKIYKKGDKIIVTLKDENIFAEHLDKFFDPEIYIVASRHKAQSGKKTLTCHSTGIFSSDNSHGGNPKELAFSPAKYMLKALKLLKKYQIEGYDVCMEATHHGPTSLKRPIIFVEVGSTEEEWNDLKACEVVARVIDELEEEKDAEVYIGFGGPHYTPHMTKKALEKNYAFGHICPSYSIQYLDKSMFKQMIEKTIPHPKKAFLDWKGLKGSQRQQIKNWCEEFKLQWEK